VTPRFAVVVPARDPGPALGRALRSVLDQTAQDWEAVVVDDGSVEDLGWSAHLDPRIRLLRQDNAGVSAARNAGVAATTAPWIAFLDADDHWEPEKLSRVAAALAVSPEPVLVHSAFHWHLPDRAFVRTYDAPADYRAVLAGTAVLPSTAVVRRDAFEAAGRFDEDLRLNEDHDLWLRLLRSGTAARVAEPVAHYYTHAGGASQAYWDVYRGKRALLRREGGHERETGMRAGDRLARRAGRRSARRLAGAQGFDRARAALRTREARSVVLHLARAARVAPVAVLGESARWLLLPGHRAPRPSNRPTAEVAR
jgi:glycosyltransferase involved in cell wall biosynthesis